MGWRIHCCCRGCGYHDLCFPVLFTHYVLFLIEIFLSPFLSFFLFLLFVLFFTSSALYAEIYDLYRLVPSVISSYRAKYHVDTLLNLLDLTMGFLSFESFAEFHTYVTFVCIGMSIMMVISAVTGLPSFITEYYKYATGNPDAVCENPNFWNNANTYFNLGTYVTQLVFEALTLLPAVRKIPLRFRLLTGLVVPFLELIILIIVPAIKISSQSGAIVVLMSVAVLGGFSKAMCDSTTNALVGPFPTYVVNGEQWGLTTSSVLMSLLAVILKVSMGVTFEETNKQSRIYFGVAIAFQLATIIQVLLLYSNPYAQRYVAEFRMLKSSSADVEQRSVASNPLSHGGAENAEAEGEVKEDSNDDLEGQARVKDLHPEDSHGDVGLPTSGSVLLTKGDADGMVDVDQNGEMTSSDQMLRASLWSVVKKVYPMLFSTFFVFFLTLTLWPGVFFSTYTGNPDWFGTVIVLLFNIGDFLSRLVLMVRVLRPSPMACLIGSVSRVLFIIPVVLCVRGIINTEALPYILVLLFGLTNGYFGTMSMIYCPRTPTLSAAGERSLAGVVGGLFIQLGLAFGSNFAAVINGVLIPNLN